MSSTTYQDFGPKDSNTYSRRPECEGCGPFRGRYLRPTTVFANGETFKAYVCKGCDEEE